MIDQFGLDVSRETMDAFRSYEALVQKWNPAINLVAKSDIHQIWGRHIIDSVQLFQYAPEKVDKWCDIGSGGGFPGVVMAIIAREKSPDTSFTFIESDQRKAAFLRTVTRELDLKVTVSATRVEDTDPVEADVLTARALKSLDTLIPFTTRHLKPSGTAIFPKGKNWTAEIEQAKQNWTFEVDSHRSITDPEARVLVLKEISID